MFARRCYMSRGNIKKTSVSDELNKCRVYDFDKNSFVVYPVFDEKSNDTLGTILLRLMRSDG
jgi:hypothetical protein